MRLSQGTTPCPYTRVYILLPGAGNCEKYTIFYLQTQAKMAKAWVYPKRKRMGFTPKGIFDKSFLFKQRSPHWTVE